MSDREDPPRDDPELTSQERRVAAGDREKERPPKQGKRRRWRLAYAFSLLGIIGIIGAGSLYLIISRGGGEEPFGTATPRILPHDTCLPIEVVDADLRAIEEENLIYAWVYVDGRYEDWPVEGPGNQAGIIALRIEDMTWTWDHVWVGTNPPSKQFPIRVGDGFRPAEIGPDFVQALETYGWEALDFSLTIVNRCRHFETFLDGFDPDKSIQVTPAPDLPAETF